MSKYFYLSLCTIILCTSGLYSMGMEIYDLAAHNNQYLYEQALLTGLGSIDTLRRRDRAVVKPLAVSEETTIRDALSSYSSSTFHNSLTTMFPAQKNRLFLLLLAYKRRVDRGEDEGIVTKGSKMISPIGLFSAIGGLASGVTLALTSHLIAEGGMTLGKEALLGGGAYASAGALGGGLVVSLVSTPVALTCMGYESYKSNRVHNAAEILRNNLGIAPLPVINETS